MEKFAASESMESAGTESTENIESLESIESIGYLENTGSRENTGNLENTRNLDNTRNLESTGNTEATESGVKAIGRSAEASAWNILSAEESAVNAIGSGTMRVFVESGVAIASVKKQ